MMNSFILGTFTFLILSPAISICDEDLNKASTSSDSATQHPLYASQQQSLLKDDESGAQNGNTINDPWSFYRQLRAPSGFMGVRGKKEHDPASYWQAEYDLFASQPKRMPSQAFFGMRGKKYYEEKRAPSGFYGMRGKKSYYDDQLNDDLQAELYRDLQREREYIASLMEDYYMEDKDKRKPSGFVGLRGKKSVNNDDYYDFEKRAPMGFQGVRGKKSEFPAFIGSDDKRVPVAGFFGMRGKKQPYIGYQSSSNFFGVRKKPYMPYGKFVGVRGKKAPAGTVKRLRLESDQLNEFNVLRPAPRVSSDTTQDKRIGFIGMRG